MQHSVLNVPAHDELTNPALVPLPNSPQGSHGEFDALIELLASDDAPESDSKQIVKSNQTDLRDENGQLDFHKIKNMFTASRMAPRTKQKTADISRENFETGNFKVYPTANSSAQTLPVRTSSIPTLNLSSMMNSGTFDAGLPPAESTPIDATRALRGTVGTSFADSQETVNDMPLQGNPESVTSPLLDLNKALDLAQREVMDLRQRCRELEDLHGTKHSLLGSKLEGTGLYYPSPQAPSNVSTAPTNPKSAPAADDVRRALEMVAFVDELVWKRSRFGAKYDDPYCTANIQALEERLELWEHVIRTRR